MAVVNAMAVALVTTIMMESELVVGNPQQASITVVQGRCCYSGFGNSC